MGKWIEESKPSISIHSLRMEGDILTKAIELLQNISIHSLRMEGDDELALALDEDEEFQSTPSAWRETVQTDGLANS